MLKRNGALTHSVTYMNLQTELNKINQSQVSAYIIHYHNSISVILYFYLYKCSTWTVMKIENRLMLGSEEAVRKISQGPVFLPEVMRM